MLQRGCKWPNKTFSHSLFDKFRPAKGLFSILGLVESRASLDQGQGPSCKVQRTQGRQPRPCSLFGPAQIMCQSVWFVDKE